MGDVNKYNEPMPWIGLYVTLVSVICLLAMATDIILGIRSKRGWFPCKFFSMNAVTLSLLGIVVKLPMDLNDPMPGKPDQLAKLSSIALVSTAMANFMPSLALMDDRDIIINMTALGALVMSLLENVSIELGTQVIFSPQVEHIAIMFCMFVLFLVLCSSALAVSTTKKNLEQQYLEKHELIAAECFEPVAIEELKKLVRKSYILSESSNPQFVVARSANTFAICAICSLNGLILAGATVRIKYFSHYPDIPGSDYGIATCLIARIQMTAVLIGTIAPLGRWFTAAKIKCSHKGQEINRTLFKVEDYWLEKLVEWKNSPWGSNIKGHKCRKLVYRVHNFSIVYLMKGQIVIVKLSKLTQFVSVVFINLLLSGLNFSKELVQKHKKNAREDRAASTSYEPKQSTAEDVIPYVLHLEGEDELPLYMARRGDVTDKFVQKAKKQKPEHLLELFQDTNPDLCGHHKFPTQDLPNCWGMPVVTLTSIAIALPNIPHEMIEGLLCSVGEGLKYVRLVEETLDTKENLKKVREAAEATWSDVYLCCRWLDEDLGEMVRGERTLSETLKELHEKATKILEDFKMNGTLKGECFQWPVKAIVAESMYQISKNVVMQQCNGCDEKNATELFKHLRRRIAEKFIDCLTNIGHAIKIKCISTTSDDTQCIQDMACILGQVEEILKLPQFDYNYLRECIQNMAFILGQVEEILKSLQFDSLMQALVVASTARTRYRLVTWRQLHRCCKASPHSLTSSSDISRGIDFPREDLLIKQKNNNPIYRIL